MYRPIRKAVKDTAISSLKPKTVETVILIEVKYANDGNLDQACERALQQIEEKKYDEELPGRTEWIKF